MHICEYLMYLSTKEKKFDNLTKLLCFSKEKKKNPEENFWRKKYEEYCGRLDDAPETDSQNYEDHCCWPEDPHTGTSQSLSKRK